MAGGGFKFVGLHFRVPDTVAVPQAPVTVSVPLLGSHVFVRPEYEVSSSQGLGPPSTVIPSSAMCVQLTLADWVRLVRSRWFNPPPPSSVDGRSHMIVDVQPPLVPLVGSV